MNCRILAVAAAVLTLASPLRAGAQANWPTKPLFFVVPYAAGGFADTRARKIGAELSRVLGQPIVIEN